MVGGSIWLSSSLVEHGGMSGMESKWNGTLRAFHLIQAREIQARSARACEHPSSHGLDLTLS